MVSSCLTPLQVLSLVHSQDAAKDQPLTPWPSPAWRSTDGNQTNHKDVNYGHMVLYICIYIIYIYGYYVGFIHIYVKT